MRLGDIRRRPSPLQENAVRVEATIHYDDPALADETLWYDIPRDCETSLSDTGNPWLVALLPTAATLKEPLEIGLPIDDRLFRNLHQLMLVWHMWYPDIDPVELRVDTVSPAPSARPESVGMFFSGGVDSFGSALSNQKNAALPPQSPFHEPRTRDLISVWGFDVALSNAESWAQMASRLAKAAGLMDMNLLPVATNLRETQFSRTDWAHLSHNCALASVALMLELRFHTVFIPATGGFLSLDPWGSHALTDPMLSTARLEFRPHACQMNRFQKTAVIAESPHLLPFLHVCWRAGDDSNCSHCTKCYRTMLMLDVLGVAEHATEFDWSRYSLDNVERLDARAFYEKRYLRGISLEAAKVGRDDIVRAIDKCLRRTARLEFRLAILDRCGAQSRRFGPWGTALRRVKKRLLRGMIH